LSYFHRSHLGIGCMGTMLSDPADPNCRHISIVS